MSIKEIISKNQKGLIARAFNFAKKAHNNQERKSGEPFLNHPLATAEFLNQWHLDEVSIAAGLLHDTPRFANIPIETIKKEFGEEVAFLVEGVNKLKLIRHPGSATRIDNIRKMIIALSQDLRIVFIKLANRLHNLQTLKFIPPERQVEVARETNDIYAPLASQIGMQNLNGELQDLSFPYLFPKEYKWLKENVKEEYETRQKYLEEVKPILEENLEKNNLKPIFISLRAKRYSSLYPKLVKHDMDIEKIYDLVTLRLIMKNIKECYEALGVIHKIWPPLPGRIKDYIASPKPNGYRSLHTTVIGPKNKYIEIQIRTQKMHDENENGLAAHWLYKQNQEKENENKKSIQKTLKEVLLLKHLRRWQNNKNHPAESYEEFIKAMKIDFFKDRIFAITPKGEVIDLPIHSTPVDFAYKIHSEIGQSCVKSKINGELKPLSTELKSGDVVEIITQKGKKPSINWLSFVKTAIARDHIKNFLKEKEIRLFKFKTKKTD